MSYKITMLPSDSFSVYIKQYLFQYPNIKRPMRTIDMTDLYNWYVENFESKFTKISSQNNTMLFKFIMEYYLFVWTNNIHMYYADGYSSGDINSGNLMTSEDIDLTFIYNYINTNGIPCYKNDYDLIDQLNEHLTTLREFCNRLITILQGYGIVYNNIDNLDLQNLHAMHVPLQWYDTYVDMARVSYGIHNYDRQYPYRVKLELLIISLTLEDYTIISPGVFNSIMEDVSTSNYVLEDLNGNEL